MAKSDAEPALLELLRGINVVQNIRLLRYHQGKVPYVLIPSDCHVCIAEACPNGNTDRIATIDDWGLRIDTSEDGSGRFVLAFKWDELPTKLSPA